MSDVVIVAIIAGVSSTVAPTVAVIMGLKKVHATVNSRMDELLRLARKEAHQEGVDEERLKSK